MKKLNLNSKLKQWNLDWWGARCPYSRKLKQITHTQLIALVNLSQTSWWANIPNEQKMETKEIFIQISIASARIHSFSYDFDNVSFYLGLNSQRFFRLWNFLLLILSYTHIRRRGIWVLWFVAMRNVYFFSSPNEIFFDDNFEWQNIDIL